MSEYDPRDPDFGDDDESFDEDLIDVVRRPLGAIVDPVSESGEDDEADAVALEYPADDPSGVDHAPQDDGEVMAAEEAAMHLTADPPMGGDDGYLR